MIRSAASALSAWLDLKAAEARSGVSLVEAVAADAFETELRTIVGTEAVAEAREVALDAAKFGVGPEDARAAFRQWVGGPYRLRYELAMIGRYVAERIRAND